MKKSRQLRIYHANRPLFERYPPEHPAVRALTIQAEACDICVGREIDWKDTENPPIEHRWYSASRQREQQFSSLAYEFISYDLLLDGWLKMPPAPSREESIFLFEDRPVLATLLRECRASAEEAEHETILPLIKKAEEYVEAYSEAILTRFRECNISIDDSLLPAKEK